MKKATLLLCVLMLLQLCLGGASAQEEDTWIVYANAPAEWGAPYLWAWGEDGTNAFADWPGEEMTPDPANEGWYFCRVPAFATYMLISADDGMAQTSDQPLQGNAWVTITDAQTVTVSYDAQTEGDAPAPEEKTIVHASLPPLWLDPHVQAWAEDGSAAYSNEVGKAMRAEDDGWFTASVPAWAQTIAISAGDASSLSDVIEISGPEAWIVVEEDGNCLVLDQSPVL